MPGHLIAASCPCGFSGIGRPGSSFGEGTWVMAYDALAPDGESLVTLIEAEAISRGFPTIEDPALGRSPRQENYYGPWGGYECPKCQQASMTLALRGFWD